MRKREKSMKFRPCIDIHNGKVKQIVGGSLMDTGNQADENFVSDYDGGFYANLYKENGLTGGHIILLNPVGSDYYEADVKQAKAARMAYPGGLQIGGGMNADNARRFLDMGASHIIVTSYVFRDGQINYENLEAIKAAVGKEHLVLDLSCRKRDGKYYVVTNRWQKYTDVELSVETLDHLSSYCDEFLIHAVDVEGKASGIEQELVTMIGEWNKIPVTYAGGVRNEHDLQLLKELGHGQLDVTIGSALDLFGGSMKFESVLKYCD
jgi:phosphoribosylformimino-5-aminoimidazole carboxamide ribotide isomerase